MGRDRAIERSLLLQDLLVVLLSVVLAALARTGLADLVPALKPLVPVEVYLQILIVFVPTWAWCAERLGLYSVRTITGPLFGILRAVLFTQAWGAAALGLILVAAQAPINRSLVALFLAVSTALLLVAAIAQRTFVRQARGQILALIMGGEDGGLQDDIVRMRGRVVERLSAISAADLRQRLREGGVDEVVLGQDIAGDVKEDILRACQEAGVPALACLADFPLDWVPPRAEMLGRRLFLTYERHQPDRPALLIKALMDRALATSGLLALLPFLILVAALIKLTSRGPALFIQQRGGLNGRPFKMLKFRTMRLGAEGERAALLGSNQMDGPVFKLSDDPRVTRIGYWLRRTSIDELPQLLNVALGQMSLVGPRPLPLIETRELTGAHRRRLSMRPGLTCLWQIGGRNHLRFADWMALDLQYVDNWSLGLDFVILLRTIPALLVGRGAC